MTRFVTPANQTAFEAEHVNYAIATALSFTSGTVYAHMGVGPLVIAGQTYLGVGTAGSTGFGSISSINEKTDARDTNELYLSISGIDPYMIGKVPQRSEYYNQFASVLFIPIDPVTNLPLSPAEPAIYEGFMDQLVYTRKQGSAQIQVTVKHYDSLFQQSSALLFTDESQKGIFSTDNFFNQVASLPNKKAQWGGTQIDSNTYIYGGRGSIYGYGPGR